jgi:hypothetical protein
MKQTITRLKRLLVVNTLLLVGYVAYNELYTRYFPQQTQAVCQILGIDQEKNMVAVNCVKR